MSKQALLFEPTGYHHTLLPCYMRYLVELGYEVDLLVHTSFSLEDDFSCFSSEYRPSVTMFDDLSLSGMGEIVDFDFYDLVWVTTINGSDRVPWDNPFDAMGFYPSPMDGLYGTIHALDVAHDIGLDYSKFSQVFSLADPGASDSQICSFSLSFYGEHKRGPRKLNDGVDMLIVGVSVSMPAVTKALTDDYGKDLKIVAIGSTFGHNYWRHAFVGQLSYFLTRKRGWKWFGAFPLRPSKLKKAFSGLELRGFATSSDMYAEVEKADFLIANFERDVLEKFSKRNISGQALFSLGYQKPLILPASVAAFWGFDDSNSVVFADGDFASGMRRAMEMDDAEYKTLVRNIEAKTEADHDASLDILKIRIAIARDKKTS